MRILSYFLILAGAFTLTLFSFLPIKTISGDIESEKIQSWRSAFLAELTLDPGYLYYIPADATSRSTLKLYENGIPVEPAHGSTTQIASGGKGFTHRSIDRNKHRIYFSPINAEEGNYSFTTSATPRTGLLYLGVILLLLGYAIFEFLHRSDPRPIRALDRFIAVFAVIGFCLLVSGSLTSPVNFCGDARQGVGAGLHLSQKGEYKDPSPTADSPYFRREPFYPFYVALLDLMKAPESYDLACVSNCQYPEGVDCGAQLVEIKKGNLLFLALTLLGVWWLVATTTASATMGLIALVLLGFSLTLQAMVDSLTTELHAATLAVMVSCFSVAAFKSKSRLAFCLLGLSSGALTLTKVIFAPFGIALFIAHFLAFRSNGTKRKLVIQCLALLTFSYCLVVGGWMMRNYIAAGKFTLVEKRSVGVLNVRASYNRMNMKEYWAGYLYYTPWLTPQLEKLGVPKSSFSRFDTQNENGFRRLGQIHYRKRLDELSDTPVDKSGVADMKTIYSAKTMAAVSNEAKDEILASPLKHLLVTPLLAYRGVFIESGLGFKSSKELDPDSGSLAMSLNGIVFPFTPLFSTIFNILSGLSLLLAPFLGAILWRSWVPFLVAFPALYNHGMYALVSHFIPRYALTGLPLRYASLFILLFICISRLAKVSQTLLQVKAVR